MKTMKKSRIQSTARRMDRRSRSSKARKMVMAFGAMATVAALGRMLRSRRAH